MAQKDIRITASTTTTGNGSHEAYFTITKELGPGVTWVLTQEGRLGLISVGAFSDERTALNAAKRAAVAWLAKNPDSVDD